jgi:iron complex transport system substrate-binding protein
MKNFLILVTTLFFTTFTFANDLRIVSVGGGVTEAIYALGGQQYLVGVDTTSTWPEAAKKLPQVGYQRSLAPEGILSLKPTVLIGTSHTGPETTLQQIKTAGVNVVILPSEPKVKTIQDRIYTIAKILNKIPEGNDLWFKVEDQLATAKLAQAKIKEPKKVLFLLAVPGRPAMVAGKNTEADLMIQLAGGRNVVNDFNDYRVLTPEAIQALNPDVILVTDDGLQSMGGLEQLKLQPGIAHTNAAKNNKFISMDANFLLSLGPRTGEAVLQLSKSLNQ